MNRAYCILLFLSASLYPSLLFAMDQSSAPEHKELKEIYIVSHGWHTGFVVSAQDIQSHIPELRKRFGNTPNIELGWGDKGFYQAEKITAGLTLRALFWPTTSVIHAVAVPENVENYFSNSNVEKRCITAEAHSDLMQFISDSFNKSPEGKVTTLIGGIYGNSQFYEAVGIFHLMSTCNKWTAKGLKSTGMDISPTFRLTASSIMKYLAAQDEEQENHCNQ